MKEADSNLVVVIMAGGAGTRFWPVSTKTRPKQFLRLFGDRTLLQLSYDRLSGVVGPERVLVLTNEDFVPLVREQLPELPPENVLGEPYRRDTGAAVCLAALLARKRFGNPVIATLTADHLIGPVDLFQRTLRSAVSVAATDAVLYTFGVRPDFPSTAYGYLEIGEKIPTPGDIEHFRLKSFKEKPDRETAEEYVSSGRFLWNSGMFVWQADAILAELEHHLPDHLSAIAPAVELDGPVVLMHMQGTPATMQDNPHYDDALAEVAAQLAARAKAVSRRGISSAKIILDPGIGFGKRLEDNVRLIRGIPKLMSLGYPVLIGLSRKGFLGAITGRKQADMRLAATIAANAYALLAGADILRVHDVRETVDMKRVLKAIGAED